jgi:16S rRNA (guanine966-N2)-methyltransferase
MLFASDGEWLREFMRITGGKLGGRRLVAPDDIRVRPTSDRIRQAIFNMLLHRDFGIGFTLDGAAVLDLFAGTGALGIEAISHGARWCLMVDDSADSRAIQRENVEALGLTGATKIWRRDATDLGPMGPSANGPFDLVFLDPPYRKELIPKALVSLAAGGWLTSKALIVAETDAKEELDTPGLTLIEERDYGETKVRFLTPTSNAREN